MSTNPTVMRAIDIDEPGGPDVLKPVERPVPQPGPGEVLIRVECAGVNRPDIMQRLGLYPPPTGAPSIPGLEVAGVVAALGDGVDPTLLGKSICALLAGGGYAEFCTAPAGQCLPIPTGYDMVEAASLPETFFTVWTNLFQLGRAKAGDWVLVHGGTSGIGTTAILLGRLFGLTTIVTAGSDAKCARAMEIGAAHAVNYKEQNFAEEVKRLTDGRGVDVVLDMIGGDYLARNLAVLREEGRHVSIAVQRGVKGELPIWEVMRKRLVLTGSTLRPRSVEYKSQVARELREKIWPLLDRSEVRPVIDSIIPLSEAAEAHRRMESSAHVGKIMLQVRG